MARASLDLIRGTLDLLILKTLTWGPLHGYAIASTIKQSSDGALLVEEGALYPALYRMEEKGWIESEWGRSSNNRRAKYYRLTARGRQRFRSEKQTWNAYAVAVEKVLATAQPPVEAAALLPGNSWSNTTRRDSSRNTKVARYLASTSELRATRNSASSDLDVISPR